MSLGVEGGGCSLLSGEKGGVRRWGVDSEIGIERGRLG